MLLPLPWPLEIPRSREDPTPGCVPHATHFFESLGMGLHFGSMEMSGRGLSCMREWFIHSWPPSSPLLVFQGSSTSPEQPHPTCAPPDVVRFG